MSDRKYISHYKIFDYWKDKYITPNGEVISHSEIKSFDDYPGIISVVDDWGEPECWCCGRWTNEIIDEDSEKGLKDLYKRKHVTSFLQRAHIIPRQLGGSDTDPANLFLLCSECHQFSPDTVYPTEFFKYVYKRRHRPASVAMCAIIDAAKELYNEGIPVYLDFERVKKEIGTHLTTVMPSSYVAVTKAHSYEHHNQMKQSSPEYEASIPTRLAEMKQVWGGLWND